MDTPLQATEGYSKQLQHLLSDTSRVVQEELERSLREILSAFTRVVEALEEAPVIIRQGLEEGLIAPDELWRDHDFRFTEKLPNFNIPEMKRELEATDKAPELLALLVQVEEVRQTIFRLHGELDELVLAAWRKEHPYFSSSGIIDSDVQSAHLKDLKALDRR